MRQSRGFTIVEVLIFVLLISLIFITLSTIATVSLSSTKYNEHKILATYYTEELREWLRGEKEANWEAFPKSGSYCFNTAPISTFGLVGTCGSSYSLGVSPNNIFRRYVIISPLSSTSVNIAITVEWKETGNTYNVLLNTTFALYE